MSCHRHRPPLTVTIQGPRGEEWEKAVGTSTFPVTTFQPLTANLPDKPSAEIWLVNLGALEPGLFDRIIEHLANKWKLPVEECRREALQHGIPILAEDAWVVLNDVQRWAG